MSNNPPSHITASRAVESSQPSEIVAAVSPAATDHQLSDPDRPTTPPAPTAASPPPTNDGQVNARPSFVRHCPSSTNRDAYKKKTGRQLAPLLIDESGMGARFHLLDNEIFSAHIPGNSPTAADRKKFKSPKLKKGMRERDIYPQLVSRRHLTHSDHRPVLECQWTDQHVLSTRAPSSSPS